MRGLGHPDTFLGRDLGVRQALGHLGLAAERESRWAPWRSYAVHQLWAGIATGRESATPPPEVDR
jgi:AraC family transcriptional regulator of adaptative response / DNA-3-methyladenine glycosylase II